MKKRIYYVTTPTAIYLFELYRDVVASYYHTWPAALYKLPTEEQIQDNTKIFHRMDAGSWFQLQIKHVSESPCDLRIASGNEI